MRLALLPILALPIAAQTPSFEVASLRPAKSVGTTPPPICGNLNVNADSVMGSESLLYSGVHPLAGLIESAYRHEVDDIDFPDWTRGLHSLIAVSVKIPPGTTFRTCRKMLQNLLAERFHMVVGTETREVSRLYMKVAKSGLKLKSVAPPAKEDTGSNFDVKDGNVRYTFRGASAFRVFSAIRATALLDALSFYADFRIADVVDETGLTGNYEGGFEFTLLRSNQSPLSESLGDALARQLGLTLELRRAPGKVLVIRSSDRLPTEN